MIDSLSNNEPRMMKLFRRCLSCAGLLLVLRGDAALAADDASQPIPPRERAFKNADKNDDGRVDAGEYVGGSLGRAAAAKREEFDLWDLNDDGSLNLEEFKKRGNQPKKRRDPEEDFRKWDKDEDEKLTYAEYVDGRAPYWRKNAQRTFFKMDRDGDDVVTFEESEARYDDEPQTARQQFRVRDADRDGVLSEEEFLTFDKTEEKQKRGRVNFRRFDIDEDGGLAFEEFALTPGRKPDVETMFRGLDRDDDMKLTVEELVRLFSGGQVRRARRTFGEYDADADGFLSLSEYKAREDALASARRKRWWSAVLDKWGVPSLLIVDGLVVLFIGVSVRKRRRRRGVKIRAGAPAARAAEPERKSRRPAAQKQAATRDPGVSDSVPLSSPESIDEFQIT